MFRIFILLFSLSTSAWDFGVKGEFNANTTDNVNSSSSNLVKDTITSTAFTGTMKNKSFKVRAKLKMERYQVTKGSDSTTLNLNTAYLPNKDDEYSFGIFKQTYAVSQTVATANSTTYDNSGAKAGFTFNNTISKKQSGYFSLNGTYTNYSSLQRSDKAIDSSFGLEIQNSSEFTTFLELFLAKTFSTDPQYNDYSLAPYLGFSWFASDKVEVFGSANYNITFYSDRIFTTNSQNGRTNQTKEVTKLMTTEIGINIEVIENLNLQGKYINSKNSSNNPINDYKANSFGFNINLKF